MEVKTSFTAFGKKYDFTLETDAIARNYNDEDYAYWIESRDGHFFEINIWKSGGKFKRTGKVYCFADYGSFENTGDPEEEYKLIFSFVNPPIETHDFEILYPEDVARFFMWLVFDCKINFHPDDDFEQYENMETHELTFSEDDARYYNYTMRECFDVCEKYNRSIYEIATRVLKLYHYCDGNDTLANIGEG